MGVALAKLSYVGVLVVSFWPVEGKYPWLVPGLFAGAFLIVFVGMSMNEDSASFFIPPLVVPLILTIMTVKQWFDLPLFEAVFLGGFITLTPILLYFDYAPARED